MREDKNVIRNYGKLLIDLCSLVPDGLVGFFPSYKFMEDVVFQWNEMGLLNDIMKHKVLFIESRDYIQTSIVSMKISIWSYWIESIPFQEGMWLWPRSCTPLYCQRKSGWGYRFQWTLWKRSCDVWSSHALHPIPHPQSTNYSNTLLTFQPS